MRSILALLVLAACKQDIDVSELPPIDDYRSWTRIGPFVGPIPGHGDSVRPVYVNDVARSYPHAGRYPVGSAIVKEILSPEGDLRYVAVMRKIGEEPWDTPPEGIPSNGGWVFTQLTDGEEKAWDLCWATCHRQAPWDGAWFDYGE